VLELLAAEPSPTTAAALAERAGQHPNTIREHLDALVGLGLAERRRAPAAGRGRPSWLYAAVEGPDAAAEYAGLATTLARQIARTSRSPRADALAAGAEWGAQLAGTRPDDPGTPAQARAGVVSLLASLGFAPEADARAMRVRLPQCPLLDAALEEPEVVCGVHLGLVRGALAAWHTTGEDTSLVPFAEPGACLLHLTGATRRTA
jgi:predicted ArsR family transcriptional regulator